MLRLSADWVMCSFSAARLNEPVSANASQWAKCLRFTILKMNGNQKNNALDTS
jgi:hypothetical protein